MSVSRGQDWSELIDRFDPDRQRLKLLAAATGVVVAVWVGLTMFSSPAEELVSPQDPSAGGAESLGPDAASDAEQIEPDEAPDEQAERITLERRDAISGTGPVFGEPIGSYLFMDRSTRLVRLDLDTGDIDTFQLGAEMIGVFDGELLLLSNQKVYALQVDAIDKGGRLIFDGSQLAEQTDGTLDFSWQPSLVLADGRVAMSALALGASGPSVRTVVIDMATDEADVLQGESWSPLAGLTEFPGSGTFDILGPEPRLVTDGVVVAAGAKRVIGHRCDNPTSCTSPVVDRATGEVLVEDLPSLASESWLSRFLGPDEKLLATWVQQEDAVFEPASIRILDVEIGAEVTPAWGALEALTSPDGGYPSEFFSLSASNDSRFLAMANDDGLAFYDRERGIDGVVELELGSGGSAPADRLIFADKGEP